jgi:hypothetical protein
MSAQGCALATLGEGISLLKGATLKELRWRLLPKTGNPFRVANNLPGHFEPRVSKQTLG